MTNKLSELLLSVRKPGRYIGGEWNSIKKEWAPDRIKVCLGFPDLYEVGMSYLGMKILYGILNDREDCLCERVFAPWPDFESVLRDNLIELYSLESRKSLKDFDIVGFSLAYELCYTNVLNMLDLGGIPKRSSARGDGDPLVIAGGPSCFNPEPMAEFIDAFVIGDGEDVIGEVVGLYRNAKRSAQYSRSKLLKELSSLDGVYVPSLYDVKYSEDGTVAGFIPRQSCVKATIKKRVVKNFDSAYYPIRQIVPNIQIVHDRIAIEIMRGCKHACRFCQASAVYRPARERSCAKVLEIAKQCYWATGHDEISLLSLSSVDHSEIVDMIRLLNKEFSDKAVSISVPSLRVEDKLSELPTLISKVKKSGLTFAPEAGSDRLRKLCGKNIDIEKLFTASEESFRAGWRHIKLYFMIGLPQEGTDDILEIASIIKHISELKRNVDGRPARVNVSINPFVPKPHTFFEREPMDSIEVLKGKIVLLKSAVKSKFIELDFHDLFMSHVEAVFSRGDRRLGDVIYSAWKAGSRFDGWKEMFNYNNWYNALASFSPGMAHYTDRNMREDIVLPWSFIRP